MTTTIDRRVARQLWRVSPDTLAVKLSKGQWQPAPHLALIAWVQWLVAAGLIRRVILNLPPGAGKSELVSHWSPVWLLEQDPTRRIIVASYEAHFAEEWGKAVRGTILENQSRLRVRLRTDSQAANRWRTTRGGGMWTAGAGGALTGRRAWQLGIDDPHKNFAEAHSKTQRDNVWDWYRSTARTRLLPRARQFVTMTRWHEDDLTGRLKETDAEGDEWVHIVLPAIAEHDETIESVLGPAVVARLRKLNVPLPEWDRKVGAPLWPTLWNPVTEEEEPWYDLDELRSTRAAVGEYLWGGLYQQHPSPPAGEMFPAAKWDRATVVPPRVPLVRYWDLAATEGDGDETVGALVCRDDDRFAYIVDVVHGRWSASDVKKVMRGTAQLDAERYGRRVRILVEHEGGASGKSWLGELLRGPLAGFNAAGANPSGDKVTRALGLAAQQQEGFVRLVQVQTDDGGFGPAPWFEHLIEQFRAFPHGSHDDVVDACASAYNAMTVIPSRPARGKSPAGRRLTSGSGLAGRGRTGGRVTE